MEISRLTRLFLEVNKLMSLYLKAQFPLSIHCIYHQATRHHNSANCRAELTLHFFLSDAGSAKAAISSASDMSPTCRSPYNLALSSRCSTLMIVKLLKKYIYSRDTRQKKILLEIFIHDESCTPFNKTFRSTPVSVIC